MERYTTFVDWKSQYYQNAIPSKAICRFNAVPKNYQWHFFIELEQKNLKILWRYKRPWIAKSILRKQNRAGRIRLPDFRPYYKVTVIKTVWYLLKNRNIDQWNRIENPEINPSYLWWIKLWKGVKTTQCWKDSLFNKWCWENWTAIC